MTPGPSAPAVSSKGLTAFFIGWDENKEEHHHDGPLCLTKNDIKDLVLTYISAPVRN